MNRLLLVLCLALGACVTSGKRGGDAAMAVYDLGMPAAAASATVPSPPLAIEVRAPYWFDSLGIEYRLAYAEPARLRDYAQARWAGPPAGLIQQRLVQQMGFIPQGQVGARCLVRVEIDEFSQVFDGPASSHGVLHARIALLDKTRSKIAEQILRIELPAPSADSKGGVAALTGAVDQLGGGLAKWREELASQGKLRVCEK